MNRRIITTALWFLLSRTIEAFLTSSPSSNSFVHRRQLRTVYLEAKSRRKSGGPSKGFAPASSEDKSSIKSVDDEKPLPTVIEQKESTSSLLQSIETGAGFKHDSPVVTAPDRDLLPAEERTKQILREQYGLKTMEEQRLNAKQFENRKEQQKRMKELKKKMENEQDIDIMGMLPPAVIIGIDRFLKGGVIVTGILFILAGLGITLEAWSKASGQALDSNLDDFITNVVEPNFTPGLFVLLGFSVSLGLFAAAQLGSSGAQYKEDK